MASAPLITRRYKIARGAKRTICSMELMATRIAQYSLSPPASPVQIRTIAIHLARPTRIKPSRRPDLSGRKAQASPSYDRLAVVSRKDGSNVNRRSSYHDKWCNDPIDDDAEADLNPNLAVLHNSVKSFISNFTQDRIHHYE